MFVLFLVEMGSMRGGFGGSSGLLLLLFPLAFLFSSHIGATVTRFAGAEQYLQVPVVVYYLIPIAVLVWGGYRLSRTVDTADPTARGVAGASVTAGYLVAVIGLILVLTTLSGPTTSQTSQQLPVLILVTGLVYPLVFGTAGGLLAHVRADDPTGAGSRGQYQAGHHQQPGGAPQGGQRGHQPPQPQGHHGGQGRSQPPRQGGSPQAGQSTQGAPQERRRDQ